MLQKIHSKIEESWADCNQKLFLAIILAAVVAFITTQNAVEKAAEVVSSALYHPQCLLCFFYNLLVVTCANFQHV